MLNLLVEKAIEKTGNTPDTNQPIFTISYSSINNHSNHSKPFNPRQLECKTTLNKIPKIPRKDNNIFQKWKSKTLEKLKNLQPSTKNSFFPVQPSKNISVKLKSTPRCQNLSSQSPSLEQEFKQLRNSFIVHKKKSKSKAYSFQQSPSKQSPMKSVYLQYKDQNKQKKKKIVTLSNIYQKKLIQNQIIKSIESSKNPKSQNYDQQNGNRVIRPKKNVSFFNTIQYKTVPKQEIRHYKYDDLDHSKRNILSRVENSFLRTTKNSSKGDFNIFNSAVTTLRATKFSEMKQQKPQEGKNHSASHTVNIRKIYTEKRSRKFMRDFCDQDPQMLRVNINNCRPWSPVKTNPLFINEDELLFQHSRTFNIFSSLQEANGDRF